MQTTIPDSNFEMFSGNTKPVRVDVLNQDGAAVDMTGASATLTVSAKPRSVALFTKAGSVSGTPINRIEFTIAPADTEALAGTYYFEVEVTDLSGRVSTVCVGYITIRANNS